MENSIIAGRYLLRAAIGFGGEARVFRARDNETGDEVAVRLALNPGVRVKAESMPASHPGWVRFLTSGEDPRSGAYQVFGLLEGRTLRHLLQSGPLETSAWRGFVDQSLDTVGALHGAGWVHGDLNADNFLLAASGWKLLELPFLRFEPVTVRSALFGSIHSLAPEQFDGAQADVLSDLYALGSLYYYAATGEYPHPGASVREVAVHCLRFPPEPLCAKASALPASWNEWVMQLLASPREDRPASIAAARQLLADALA